MMQVHKTQNLKSMVQINQSTNSTVSSRDFRVKNYSEQLSVPDLSAVMGEKYSSISFEGKKKPSAKDVKKVIKAAKKIVGEIKTEPKIEVKRGDRSLKSGSSFDRILNLSEYEPAIQAAVAALVCMVLRPLTIMSLPNKSGSQDNAYAASHAFASGLAGLMLTTPLTMPFKRGANYAMEILLKDMSKETLKRMYPHLDLNSIVDKSGKRLEKHLWKDIQGNRFSQDLKGVAMLPEFRQLADISTKTFEQVLGIKNVDWAAQKGKSFNDVMLRDGKSLYNTIKMDKLGIVVDEDGFGKAQILLKDLDHEYLEKLIKDSSGNNWGKLDINSVYADKEKNIIKDFREWKSVDGKSWKLDLDQISVSSELETAEYRPRRTGAKRFDKKEQKYKFNSYQNNASTEGGLGTKIDEKMVEAGLANEGQMKVLTWLPDIAFRIPIAATTIALIPWSLKNIFHIEKSSSKAAASDKQQSNTSKNEDVRENKQGVSFKGKWGDPRKAGPFVKWLGKNYGKKVIESETIHKHSGKLAELPGELTAHMATLGSFVTSSVYVQQTLNKKELDKDKRRTLAINQILCFFIPTVLGYYVNSKINRWVKNIEYRYTGLQRHEQAMAKAAGRPYTAEQLKVISEKTKGIRAFSSLIVFTAIYRYISPVAITPIANWIGNKVNAKKDREKEMMAKQIQLKTENNKTLKQVG